MDDSNVYTEDSDTKEINGNKLTDFATKTEEIAKEYHLPFIENYYSLGFNKLTRGIYFPANDGTHPNEAGRRLIAKHISSGLVTFGSGGFGSSGESGGNYVEQIEYNSTDGSLRGRVYVVDHTGTQTSKELRTTGTYDSIPLRNGRGNFYVGAPSLDLECTNKKYVDDLIKAIENRLTAGGL